MLYETKKSSRSITLEPSPKGWNPDSRLKPRIAGRDSTKINTRFTSRDFFRVQLPSSTVMVMMFSNTAMTVESAAKDMNTKKQQPQMRPPTI